MPVFGLSHLQKRLLSGAALLALSAALPVSASYAQTVDVDAARTTGISTSSAADDGTAADVTITSTGSITTTETTAVTLDSDNAVAVDGAITITDVDDATGVDLQGGNTGSFTLSSSITVNETFEPEDTDNNGTIDGGFAEGTGRTGILVSGASPFTGDITTAGTSSVNIEGNTSAAIRILGMSGLAGDLNADGNIGVNGSNSFGIDVAGDVTGNVNVLGSVSTRGENTVGVNIAGNVSEGVTVSGDLLNTGYRFATRQNSFVRDLLDEEDTLQAGSALQISGDVGGGVYIAATRNDEGAIVSRPTIGQAGSAAAVLISGNGTPILVGLVADVTDPDADDFDSTLQYGVINEGTISGAGILDDVSATGVRIEDATITGGFSNASSITAQTFRSGNTGEDTDVLGDAAHAYGVAIGSGGNLERFGNTGTISASAQEASDTIFAGEEALGANDVIATAINVETGAVLTELTNTGTITALISGRQGQAYAIVDESGSLATLNNQGIISAVGVNSNPDTLSDDPAPVFTLVAIDLSANTTGVTLTQSQREDTNPDDGLTPITPAIIGNVTLGSGDDTLVSTSGSIFGNVSFGDGADTLNLDNTSLLGSLNDSDGDLTISLTNNASLTLNSATTLNATSVSFDGTSSFSPVIDEQNRTAPSLTASGEISFAEGATISPLLSNVIGEGGAFTLFTAGSLSTPSDVSSLLGSQATPFLYDVSLSTPDGTNDLVATFALRNTSDLGLDAAQSSAFASGVFPALQASPELGAAFVSITDGTEFNAAYNQLLPEFSAAIGQFISANVDGSTGAVATHLENARLSNEKPGGVWIEEFGYFADRELANLSEAYRGYGFGFTGGFDTDWGPFHTIGFNLGFAATEVEDVLGIDDPLNVQSLQAGIYAGYETGNFGLDGYLGGGISGFENNRIVEIGTFTGRTEAEWTGTHFNAALNAGYDVNIGDTYFMRPTVGVSFISLKEQSHIEDGNAAIRLAIADRQTDIGSATALLNFGGRWENDKIWWRPSARIGIRNDFANDGSVTSAVFANTGSMFNISSSEFPDTGIVFGLSFMAGSRYSSFGFDYDGDVRDGFSRHTARLVLRLLF